MSDVVNSIPIEYFKKKREEWLACLNGNDVHSIWKQQSSLLWDYALFQTIRALRKNSLSNPTAGVGFNESVVRLFEAGFAVIQAASIRRLTEKQSRDRKTGQVIPSKRVISLKALVDEISDNRELLTREVYVGLHGLPLDPTPAKQRHFDKIAVSGQNFFFEGLDTTGPEAWSPSERAHERFDKLSERTPASRSNGDLVSRKWFDLMNTKIQSCEDICVLTDKFIAHAADPISRAGLKGSEASVSLSRLAECHQAMLKVTRFISESLLQDSMNSGLPVPQFDFLQNLDKAWVSKHDLEETRDSWQHYADEIEKWAMMTLEC
jgi:hypothetical protein